MIQFFRRARQRLLSENRFYRYIVYAIGEIFLIVIGILIALQINNWNAYKKDRNAEKLLLSNLKEEFIFNLSELKNTELRTTKTISMLRTLMGHFGSDIETLDIEYLDSLLYWSFWSPSFDSNQDVFNSIYNSGKMDLISNSKLRKMLLSWGSKRRDFELAETYMRMNFNRNVMPKMEKIVALRNSEKFGTLKSIRDSKLMPDNRVILNNLEAENILFNHLWELDNLVRYYPVLYASFEDIISELEK